MMSKWTRRDLLKAGIAAPAAAITVGRGNAQPPVEPALRPKHALKQPGEITLSASAAGLEGASVMIQAEAATPRPAVAQV